MWLSFLVPAGWAKAELLSRELARSMLESHYRLFSALSAASLIEFKVCITQQVQAWLQCKFSSQDQSQASAFSMGNFVEI
jgi:hypothetical protein